MLNKAEINLKNLKKNVSIIKKRLPKGVKLCAVVKADAYGHGAEVCSSYIYSMVDCYAVALVEEGVKLRYSGIDKEILVLTPVLKEDIEVGLRHNLTLTVTNKRQVEMIERTAKELAVSGAIHIKYDTGMGRYGVKSLKSLKSLLEYIAEKKRVKLKGFYSHFACPEIEKERVRARDKFLLAKDMVKSYNNKVTFHISASGGFLAGEYFDMVRIGILLYGYKPFETDDIKVFPVMKIKAPVIATKKIKKGSSALYGTCPAKEETKVALVRYGYADGLERKSTEREFNNRCMDLTAIKLENNKKPSRYYPVLGDAKKIAESYQTISYEILTKASLRAEKIYKR